MIRRRARRGEVRRTGLWTAVAVAILTALCVSVVVLRHRPQSASIPPAVEDLPPDIMQPPPEIGAPGTSRSEGIHVELADKSDPSRRAAVLSSRSVEPAGPRRYLAQEPSALFALKDGRTVRVRADHGTFAMPSRQEAPESGTFEKNVLIEVFDPAPADTSPVLVGRTGSLSFDSALGEVTTKDVVTVAGSGVDFKGQGLRVVFDQRRQDIELLRIESDGTLTYRPQDRAAAAPAPATPAVPQPIGMVPAAGAHVPASATSPSVPQPPAASPGKAPSLATRLYRAVTSRGVRIEQSGRTITAQTLEGFARLIDNKLSPKAVTPVRTFKEPAPSAAEAAPSLPPAAQPASSASPPAAQSVPSPSAPSTIPASESHNDDAIALSWSGPLEIRPFAGAEPMLSGNDLAFRLRASPEGDVRFADPAQNAQARAQAGEYAATQARLTLTGDERTPARIELPGTGTATGRTIMLDGRDGLARLEGKGELIAATEHQSAAWSERATLRFFTRPAGLTSALRQAVFEGDVRLRSGGSELSARHVEAGFVDTATDEQGPPLSSLASLLATGRVQAQDGKGSTLCGEVVEGRFAGPAGQAPSLGSVRIAGDASVTGVQGTLAAREINARLSSDDRNQLLAQHVQGDGDVRLATPQGYFARADALDYDRQSGEANFTGEEAVAGRDGTLVRGSRIALNADARTLSVPGAGSFEHRANPKDTSPQIVAAWAEQMSYDDAAGVLHCRGRVRAEHTPDAQRLDRVQAHDVLVQLEPQGPEDSQRRVCRVVAKGYKPASGLGEVARVQTRRFAPAAAAQAGGLERLMYLEGMEVRSDQAAGTLEVPTAGRLLIADRRSEKTEPAAIPADLPASGQGTALFDWAGSLLFTQGTGLMEMAKNVRLRHKEVGQAEVTELRSDTMRATIRTPGGAGAGEEGQLLSATALGSVQAFSAQRELSARELRYDAVRRLIEAGAGDGGEVTMLDPARAAPVTAKSLLWDLGSGRIEITRPGPIVAPR